MHLTLTLLAAAMAAKPMWALSLLLNITGFTGANTFGFGNQTVFAEGWSQNAGFVNVTITAPMEDNSGGGPAAGVQGVVYLVNQIGPGATAANNVAPPVSISGLTPSFATRTLWTGLSLPPGNYYVVWVPTTFGQTGMTMSPEAASGVANLLTTVLVGITPLGSGSTANTPAAFPPATSLTLLQPGDLFINVAGDPAPVVTPAPPSAILLLTALAALSAYYIAGRVGGSGFRVRRRTMRALHY